MNSISIVGRLTRDPETKYVGEDKLPTCRFALAVRRPSKGSDGFDADFIEVIAWRKQAELCGQYLSKGKMAGVTGRLQTGVFEDSQGQKHKFAQVLAERVDFLSPRDKNGETAEIQEDDIPF
jgi:single-strand DNA-binding protein